MSVVPRGRAVPLKSCVLRGRWPKAAAVRSSPALTKDIGGEPADNPKSPQDVLATMYRHLGIDTTAQYEDHTGRPHPVLASGTPIDELFT